MNREFISLPKFIKNWYGLGLTEEDLIDLENSICLNPEIGDVIQGTDGLRKIRIKSKGKGKRGGSRVLYVDFTFWEKVYFIHVYPKNEKDDLNSSEKEQIRDLINLIRIQLERL